MQVRELTPDFDAATSNMCDRVKCRFAVSERDRSTLTRKLTSEDCRHFHGFTDREGKRGGPFYSDRRLSQDVI